MFISIQRYGIAWLVRPIVLVMFVMSALSLLRPMLQDIRERHGIKAMLSNFGQPHLSTDNLFPAALLCLFLLMLWMSIDWSFEAKIVPTIVGLGAIISCSLSLANDIFAPRLDRRLYALQRRHELASTQKDAGAMTDLCRSIFPRSAREPPAAQAAPRKPPVPSVGRRRRR
jgi:hypothetical protein